MADADLKIKVATEPKDPFSDVKESLKDLDNGIAGTINKFKGIGAAVASVAAVGTAFNFILDATRETEDLTKQFVRFTGSVQDAEKQLNALKDIEGPALPELAEANRTLFSFGVSAKASIDQIKALADVATGSGAKVNELAEIFGKIQLEGNLTAETFSKLQKQVPGLAKDIAASLDIPEQSLKRLAAAGELTSREVLIALEKMTSEGGRYFGAADTSTQGLSGSFGELQENVTKLAAEIGGRLTPAMADSTNSFSGFIQKITDYLRTEREIASDPTLTRLRELETLIDNTTTVLNNLNTIKQGEGIAALGKFLYGGEGGLDKYIDKVSGSLAKLGAERAKLLEQQDTAAAEAAIAENAKAIEEAQQKADDKAFEAKQKQRQKEIEAEEKAAEERKKKIADAEAQVTQLLAQETTARFATQDAIAEAARQRQAEADQKAVAAKLLAEQEAATGTQIIRSNAEIAEEVRRAEAAEKLRVSTLEAVTARESEVTTARVQAEAARAELLGQYEQAEAMRQQDLQRKLTETQKKGEADRLAAIRKAQKEEFDIELQTANAKKQFDEQTYAQRLATAQAGLNALSGLMKSKNREAFEIGKAAAIAQALVSIPATAIEAYKSLAGVPLVGPALGAAAAAAAVFAGYEQVKNIQNTRLAMAEGGMVPGQGNRDTVPALLTPGEVVVPKKNFGDLQDAFVRGAVADDQVMLLQAGNNIQMRILDTLTYGTINEKLTLIVAGLDNVKSAISNLPVGGSGNSTPITVPEVQVAIEEIDRNVPVSSRQRKQETLQTKSRVDDMR